MLLSKTIGKDDFFSYRQFRIGGGVGKLSAAAWRFGRTGREQQRADACPRAGVENTKQKPNITSIGVPALTRRGFNEQVGGGVGRTTAA